MSLTETLPARWYTDPGVFDRERWPIFGSSWIHVAYEFQLRNKGDYLTEDIAGWPIFIRMGDDGVLRGFHNLCPHRAGPIVWEGSGCRPNMVCRYHGWAFNADGTLRNARDFGCTPPDRTDLTPIQVATYRGMVWVCLNPETAPLEEWLGDFPEQLAEYPLESYTFHSRTVRTVKCNWKAYGDNFVEGYHVPTVHPKMSRDADSSRYEVIFHGDDRWNIHKMPPYDTSTFSIFGYFYPTFAFDVFPGGFAVERWLPRGHDTTELIFEYFFADDADDVEEIIKFSEDVADEDVRVVEHVQRNLSSGMYDRGYLSPKWEEPVAVFHRLVREAVGELD